MVVLENLHLSKGWLDSSVCVGEPGFEQRETLENTLKTAAKSGFTHIVTQPDTPLGIETAKDTYIFSNQSLEQTQTPVTLHVCANLTTQKSQHKELTELYDLHQKGVRLFGDYKMSVQDPKLLQIALDYSDQFGGVIQSYPQDDRFASTGIVNESPNTLKLGIKGIPSISEELQVQRDLTVLKYTNAGRLHFPTLSTTQSTELIKKAKQEGLSVSCSVTPHHLLLSDERLEDFKSVHLVLPPLRQKEDCIALQQACKSQMIDMIASDHRPLTIEEKKVTLQQATQGSIGMESCFGAIHKAVGLDTSIHLLTNGKNVFGIDNPSIMEGNKADITLFNPQTEYTFSSGDIVSTQHNSIFLGEKLKGKAYGVYHQQKLLLNHPKN